MPLGGSETKSRRKPLRRSLGVSRCLTASGKFSAKRSASAMNQLCCSRYGIQSLGGGLHRFSSKPSFVQEYEALAMCFTLSAARGIPDLYDAPAPKNSTGGAWAPPRKRYANECTEKGSGWGYITSCRRSE